MGENYRRHAMAQPGANEAHVNARALEIQAECTMSSRSLYVALASDAFSPHDTMHKITLVVVRCVLQ